MRFIIEEYIAAFVPLSYGMLTVLARGGMVFEEAPGAGVKMLLRKRGSWEWSKGSGQKQKQKRANVLFKRSQ